MIHAACFLFEVTDVAVSIYTVDTVVVGYSLHVVGSTWKRFSMIKWFLY